MWKTCARRRLTPRCSESPSGVAVFMFIVLFGLLVFCYSTLFVSRKSAWTVSRPPLTPNPEQFQTRFSAAKQTETRVWLCSSNHSKVSVPPVGKSLTASARESRVEKCGDFAASRGHSSRNTKRSHRLGLPPPEVSVSVSEFRDVVFDDVVFDNNCCYLILYVWFTSYGVTELLLSMKHHILRHHIPEFPKCMLKQGRAFRRLRRPAELTYICIYIYIYIYVYVFMYLSLSLSLSIYLSLYIYIYTHTNTQIHVYTYIHTYIYIYIYASIIYICSSAACAALSAAVSPEYNQRNITWLPYN